MVGVKTRVTIKGDKEIIAKLKANQDKLMDAAVDAVNNGLVILEKSMKKYCPVNKDPKDTDTIHLKESIKIKQPAKKYKTKVIGKVGPEKDTAIHVEFGTSKMDARPFMRIQPTIIKDEVRKAAADIMKGALGL
jgi:HK97 gp10 family phage protein